MEMSKIWDFQKVFLISSNFDFRKRAKTSTTYANSAHLITFLSFWDHFGPRRPGDVAKKPLGQGGGLLDLVTFRIPGLRGKWGVARVFLLSYRRYYGGLSSSRVIGPGQGLGP